MENIETIKSFLETSTIHGLSYISTTKKYFKLFWILIVIAGFTAAGAIIYQSFEVWHESPIKTTIETLPLTKMKGDAGISNAGTPQLYLK